jgi:hypothetical protein
VSYMDEVPFPEFGPEYVRPAGEPCPDCECCSLRLCEKASAGGLPCMSYSDLPGRVSGCPCTSAGGAR